MDEHKRDSYAPEPPEQAPEPIHPGPGSPVPQPDERYAEYLAIPQYELFWGRVKEHESDSCSCIAYFGFCTGDCS